MQLPNSVVHAMLDAAGINGPDRQVGLSTTPITVTPTGLSGITEPTAPSYVRVDLPASAWSAAADRAARSTPVVFPDPAEDWGVAVAYFLTDAAGVPEIAFQIGGGGINVAAGASRPTVTPRIPARF